MSTWRDFVMGRREGLGEHRPEPSFPWTGWPVNRQWCSCGWVTTPCTESQARDLFAGHLRHGCQTREEGTD